MKIKYFIIVVFIILPVMLGSCNYEISDHLMYEAACSYVVPGFFSPDLKGKSGEIIEKDNYGKVLYHTTGLDMFSNDVIDVYIIIQKKDNESVAFYEDTGFVRGKMNDEQLADYKKINEWNLPIDDSRLSYRKIEITFDIFIKSSNLTMNKLKSAIKDKLDIGDSVFDIAFDDENGNGKFLYVVRCESKEKQEFYFVISDDKYNLSVLKVDNIADFTSSLNEFKQNNGWGN